MKNLTRYVLTMALALVCLGTADPARAQRQPEGRSEGPRLFPQDGVGLTLSPSGTLRGELWIVPVTLDLQPAALSPESEELILRAVDDVSSIWGSATYWVCGSDVRITPSLAASIHTVDRSQVPPEDINVLYVFADSPTTDRPTLAGYYVMHHRTPVSEFHSVFDALRGTGTLPAFAIAVADPSALPDDRRDGFVLLLAHELGHAMGLLDTSDHDLMDRGIDRLDLPDEAAVRGAYVQEIMTRVLDCRFDLTVEFGKENMSSADQLDGGPNWGATFSISWNNVLTGTWAVYVTRWWTLSSTKGGCSARPDPQTGAGYRTCFEYEPPYILDDDGVFSLDDGMEQFDFVADAHGRAPVLTVHESPEVISGGDRCGDPITLDRYYPCGTFMEDGLYLSTGLGLRVGEDYSLVEPASQVCMELQPTPQADGIVCNKLYDVMRGAVPALTMMADGQEVEVEGALTEYPAGRILGWANTWIRFHLETR